jgi:hypothetical protein
VIGSDDQDVSIVAAAARRLSAYARHWFIGGDYAASFGMAISINRKNRVLRAPATNEIGEMPSEGAGRHFRVAVEHPPGKLWWNSLRVHHSPFQRDALILPIFGVIGEYRAISVVWHGFGRAGRSGRVPRLMLSPMNSIVFSALLPIPRSRSLCHEHRRQRFTHPA